jgi:hypothetical protein
MAYSFLEGKMLQNQTEGHPMNEKGNQDKARWNHQWQQPVTKEAQPKKNA